MLRVANRLALLVVGVLAFAAASEAFAAPTALAGGAPVRYVGVIDAGSSGSRIGLYETRGRGRRLRVEEIFLYNPNDAGGPGIKGLSSYVAAPDRAGPDGITPLLVALDGQLAARGIPPSEVPVSTLATAGMRNVERDSPAAVTPIYASVRAAIETAGHPVGTVGTIPGRDEAVYAWTAVNALSGAFRRDAPTAGIVEIGGASAQVAFETADRGADVEVLNVMGRRRRVLAVSYLGLGRNDARATMIAPDAPTTGSPCWPNNAAGVSPAAYALGNKVAVAASTSSFDARRCADVATAAIRTIVDRPENAGLTRPTSLRRVAGFRTSDFVGFGVTAEAFRTFGVELGEGAGRGLERPVRSACTGPGAWSEVLALHGGTDSSISENACTNTTFMATWLLEREALRIPPGNLDLRSTVGGRSVNWMLGYAVVSAS